MLFLLAGLAAIAWTCLSRQFSGGTGVLKGVDLWTLRRPAEFQIERVTQQTNMAKNATLVWLRPDLGRSSRELQSASDHLESTLSEFKIETSRLKRELWRDRIDKEDQLKHIEVDLRFLNLQLTQAVARVQFSEEMLKRNRALFDEQLVSKEKYQEELRELQVDQAEVAKVRANMSALTEQRQLLERGVAELRRMETRETEKFEADKKEAEERLNELQRKRRELAGGPAASPPQKAEEFPITAPFGGKVVYKHPSPQTAGPDQPVIVLAPPTGLRVVVTAPSWQKKYLRAAQRVNFRLMADQRATPQPVVFLTKNFEGAFHGWTALPTQPRSGLAEFDVDPPAESVRALIDGVPIRARLLWQPPIIAFPEFRYGVLSILFGVAGVGLGWLWRLLHPAGAGSTRMPSADRAGDEDHAEWRVLGKQLRDALMMGTIEKQRLSEWEAKIERAPDRSIQVIGIEIGDDPAVAEQLWSWIGDLESAHPAADEWRRFARILRRAAPPALHPVIAHLERRLEQPAFISIPKHESSTSFE